MNQIKLRKILFQSDLSKIRIVIYLNFYIANMNNHSNIVQRKRSYDVHPSQPETVPRRHSMAKVHQQTIEAPIRKVLNTNRQKFSYLNFYFKITLFVVYNYKVINIICLAQENSGVTDVVKQNLEKALDILRSTELYNPALIENDKHTSDLVSGLMSVIIKYIQVKIIN